MNEREHQPLEAIEHREGTPMSLAELTEQYRRTVEHRMRLESSPGFRQMQDAWRTRYDSWEQWKALQEEKRDRIPTLRAPNRISPKAPVPIQVWLDLLEQERMEREQLAALRPENAPKHVGHGIGGTRSAYTRTKGSSTSARKPHSHHRRRQRGYRNENNGNGNEESDIPRLAERVVRMRANMRSRKLVQSVIRTVTLALAGAAALTSILRSQGERDNRAAATAPAENGVPPPPSDSETVSKETFASAVRGVRVALTGMEERDVPSSELGKLAEHIEVLLASAEKHFPSEIAALEELLSRARIARELRMETTDHDALERLFLLRLEQLEESQRGWYPYGPFPNVTMRNRDHTEMLMTRHGISLFADMPQRIPPEIAMEMEAFDHDRSMRLAGEGHVLYMLRHTQDGSRRHRVYYPLNGKRMTTDFAFAAEDASEQ